MTNPFGKSVAKVGARKGSIVAALVVGATCLMSARDASAQGWLADRRFAEGPGIRTGDVELHPGIGGEVGYDSNWFNRSSNSGANIVNGEPNLPPRDALVLRLSPSFYISTLQEQRLADGGAPPRQRFLTFKAGVSAMGRYYIGKEMDRQSNIGVTADGRVDLNAGNPIAFGVFGAFSRVVQPQVLADPNLAFTYDGVRLGGDVTFTPGGGTFDLRAGYQFAGVLYEESRAVAYTNLNHEVSIKDRWRFRPRTALFSEATLRFLNYPNAPRAAFRLHDATPLRTRLGITGLVTNRFGVLAAVGYGGTFFKDETLPSSSQFDSIIGQAEGVVYLGQGAGNNDLPGEATLLLSTVALGVQRDYNTSILSNFYTSNRAYARLEYWFGGRGVVNLNIFGEQLAYPPAFYTGVAAAQTGDFSNYRIGGSLFAEYRITQSFGINTTINYVQQFSDTLLPASDIPGVGQGVYDQNYRRLQAFLGVRYFY